MLNEKGLRRAHLLHAPISVACSFRQVWRLSDITVRH